MRANREAYITHQYKKGPLPRASFVNDRGGSAVTVMLVKVPAAMSDPDRLQLEIGDAGRDVQSGLALHADRLQRVGIRRAADQEIAAAADADRRIGADAAIIAGEFAAPDPAGRRIHRPGKLGLLGEAEIDAEAANGRDIGFGTAALALEHAFEAGDRADHEADILAALALQDAGANRRQRIGAGDRRNERRGGNTDVKEQVWKVAYVDLRLTN